MEGEKRGEHRREGKGKKGRGKKGRDKRGKRREGRETNSPLKFLITPLALDGPANRTFYK